MNFDKFFKIISYAVVFCGFLSLFVSGGIGLIATVLFALVLIGAWFLEDSRWQISERLGTAFIFVVVPLFYLGWKYNLIGSGENSSAVVGMLARMILILAGIKLLQKKADRDWLFLYLMAFFEVLLAAGLSISPLYLGALILYLLTTICAIVAFEMRKTSRSLNESKDFPKNKKSEIKPSKLSKIPTGKLPLTAASLLILIIAVGTPLFFALPRVGGAGFGGSLESLSNVTGFSDTVNLGEIGTLLQSDQIVMRARVEKTGGINPQTIKWRGIALDQFDNKKWSKSNPGYIEPYKKGEGERDYFQLNYASGKSDLLIQTVYLEPMNPPTLFAPSNAVVVEGDFQRINKDSQEALSFQRKSFDRLSYKVHSDPFVPSVANLRADNENYPEKYWHYFELPENTDPRIAELTAQITARYRNRYDQAKAVETYLQTQFAYSLEMRAGGEQPVADFLFNIRAGHCEYFASAMAIMLRTQGIATRIVNGFQQGEFNETAEVFVIKQRDAHSWVEVYFPAEKVWVPFDPTPAAQQNREAATAGGILKNLRSYIEALETFWIQYFVAYDNQEQRSLVRSFKTGFSEYQASTSVWLTDFQKQIADWWTEVRGDKGLQTSAKAVAVGFAYLIAAIIGVWLLVWLYRKIITLKIWQKISNRWQGTKNASIVEFYERMQLVLATQGFVRAAHQTPLEFAVALRIPEAIRITEKYNRVRFGEKNLSDEEASDIEAWLKNLESQN